MERSLRKARRSIRLHGYDYGQSGAYFITICSRGRKDTFGRITAGGMRLSDVGLIVESEWLKTSLLRTYVELDEFVVMPNHFHGTVFLHTAHPAGTARRAPTLERFGNPTTASIPSLIRSFKSAVTKEVNRVAGGGAASVWQRNYYEHVIRSDKALRRIREYIATNPSRWEFDPENPKQIGRDEFDVWLGTFRNRPSAKRTLRPQPGKTDPSAT